MENVTETPVKSAARRGYDSEADSGDELFADLGSVPTIPWKRDIVPPPQDSLFSSYPTGTAPTPTNPAGLGGSAAHHLTQPTQLIERPGEILVPHSSSPAPAARSTPPPPPRTLPTRPSPSRPPQKVGGRLASAMAPPGTAFRLPMAAQRAPARAIPVVDVSDDDGMPYVGDSSDDEQARRNDIKPTVLKSRQAQSGSERFSSLIGKSYFAGIGGASVKRPADSSMASPRPTKSGRQEAVLVDDSDEAMGLGDIEDYHERTKVARMRDILPRYSVKALRDALRRKRGNTDDAMDWLADQEEARAGAIDLTHTSDIEDELMQQPAQRKPVAKQTLAKPSRTINQKYNEHRPAASQKATNLLSLSDEAQKPKGRLIRGRKLPSPPQSSSPAAKQVSEEEILLDDSDSSAESEPESPVIATGSLVEFFNTCSAADLMDLSSISKLQADHVLASKPFRSLQQVRSIRIDAPKSNSRKPARTLGEKVVDICEEMFEGYEAVEQLLARCETVSQPVKKELSRWGVDLIGAASDGSVGLVSVEDSDSSSAKDSGMRTPVSLAHSADEDTDVVTPLAKKKLAKKFTQPSNLGEGVQLKEYQKIGVEWLSLLFRNRLSCILADDMGLGKTCQVVSFLAKLMAVGERGPHVIIVPASTLENWLREFHMFCPSMLAMAYHGSQSERLETQAEIEESAPYAIVTTYDIAKKKDDRRFLARLRPGVCVFDEGHALKNSQTKAYGELMKLECKFRLLLTGTPLQNNLQELCSLLGFILPQVFGEHAEQLQTIFRHKATTTTKDSHEALLSKQRINKARSMMAPFVLRRKKHQVLKHIPPKTQRVEYCEMTPRQKEVYDGEFQRFRKEAQSSVKKTGKRENVLMTLRQAAIHPWLFRRLYDDATLQRMARDYVRELPAHSYELVLEDLKVMTDSELHYMTTHDPEVSHFLSKHSIPGEAWMDSGKVEKLTALLLDYRAAGDRVLVFSQFKLVLDVLEYVLETIEVKFFRLDGSTRIEERQELLDEFYAHPEITCFMLSTKAGGAGINLACANKVIIFDQSFNPQDDVQAENRAHRLGQTRPVEVIRLVSAGTVEEQILALGTTKLALDSRVAGEEEQADARVQEKLEKEGQARVREMLLSGGGDSKGAE